MREACEDVMKGCDVDVMSVYERKYVCTGRVFCPPQ